MTVKEALEQAKCGGCAGGRHSGSCFCNDLDYELVHRWNHKYPVGSIDMPAEIFGVILNKEAILENPRFKMMSVDLLTDVNKWLKENV